MQQKGLKKCLKRSYWRVPDLAGKGWGNARRVFGFEGYELWNVFLVMNMVVCSFWFEAMQRYIFWFFGCFNR